MPDQKKDKSVKAIAVPPPPKPPESRRVKNHYIKSEKDIDAKNE